MHQRSRGIQGPLLNMLQNGAHMAHLTARRTERVKTA